MIYFVSITILEQTHSAWISKYSLYLSDIFQYHVNKYLFIIVKVNYLSEIMQYVINKNDLIHAYQISANYISYQDLVKF